VKKITKWKVTVVKLNTMEVKQSNGIFFETSWGFEIGPNFYTPRWLMIATK